MERREDGRQQGYPDRQVEETEEAQAGRGDDRVHVAEADCREGDETAKTTFSQFPEIQLLIVWY